MQGSVSRRTGLKNTAVEACATERCVIRLELLTTDMDKGDLSSVCASTLKTLKLGSAPVERLSC